LAFLVLSLGRYLEKRRSPQQKRGISIFQSLTGTPETWVNKEMLKAIHKGGTTDTRPAEIYLV
jgi:hypothetical protein